MLKRALILFLMLAPMVIAPAKSGASPLTGPTTFQINPPKNFPLMALYQIETQLNGRFRQEWGTGPVSFSTDYGIPIIFTNATNVVLSCEGSDIACHGEWATGYPEIYVTLGPAAEEETSVDHEVGETMVNPYIGSNPTMMGGRRVEVADPLENRPDYRRQGIFLVNFVGPSYFG